MMYLAFVLCTLASVIAEPEWAGRASAQAFQTFAPAAPVAAAAAKVVAKAVLTPVAAAKYVADETAVPIVRSEYNVNQQGYNYGYETGNGIVAEATGSLKHVDNADVIDVKGAYRYVSPDGTPVQLTYIANENGYQPQGDSLPVAPPVPLAILRSLEWIAAHPYKEVESIKKL